MNESVVYFEEHLELKFVCKKSLCIKGRKQELCDGVNDVPGMTEDVEEVAIPMPRIQTQMVERTADVPQILTFQQPVPVPQVTTQTVVRPCPAPQLQTVNVPEPQIMTQEMFKQVPVPVMTR